MSYTPNRQQGNKNHETQQGTFSTRKITSQNQTHHMSTHAKDVGILKSLAVVSQKGGCAFELRQSQKSRLLLKTPRIPSACMSWEPSLRKSCPSDCPWRLFHTECSVKVIITTALVPPTSLVINTMEPSC